jgi:hypothetical protein
MNLEDKQFGIYHTNLDDMGGLEITWSGTLKKKSLTSKLKVIIINEGYSCFFEANSVFLIVGNFLGHPFVITPKFQFYNSDGSTDSNIDYTNINYQLIIKLMKEKSLEYIFNQIH